MVAQAMDRDEADRARLRGGRDPDGDAKHQGGDAEICLAILCLGYDLYYDERLQFVHYMPANRLSWNYCVSMIAEGQAIPQVYFDLYKYCYREMLAGNETDFEKAYLAVRKKILHKTIRKLFPGDNRLEPMKRLIRPQEGSRKEVEVKAALNKLKFLMRRKALLSKEYKCIENLLKNIKALTPLQDQVWLHY